MSDALSNLTKGGRYTNIHQQLVPMDYHHPSGDPIIHYKWIEYRKKKKSYFIATNSTQFLVAFLC